MKTFKIKDTKAIYVHKVDDALYCDFCEATNVPMVELNDENETQVCFDCIEQLNKVAKVLKTKGL